MLFTLRDKSFDVIDMVIVAAPLAVVFILTFLIVSQTNICLADCFQDGKQFIVMPRNCYLKIP